MFHRHRHMNSHFRRGDDAVGNPYRTQISQFELFQLVLLLKLETAPCRAIRGQRYLSQLHPLPLSSSGQGLARHSSQKARIRGKVSAAADSSGDPSGDATGSPQ